MTPFEADKQLRSRGMPDLMLRRAERILLVSTPYDAYALEEDGLLSELIFTEYLDLGLSHPPRVVRASSGAEAEGVLREHQFDLIITMLQIGDMDIFRFAEIVRGIVPQTPLVLLIANELELTRLGRRRAQIDADEMYVWNGDAKLFLAIVKALEDCWNVEHDTRVGEVGVIILIEDSVRYRSALLPNMYSELVGQTRSVMIDGLNRMQRLSRMRARPKILVAKNYEEALELHEKYHDHLLGVVTDVSFKRDGKSCPTAGIDFIRYVQASRPDVPAVVQSSDPRNRALAQEVGVTFLHKKSRTLMRDLRQFMVDNFGFGDFIFRLADRTEVGRAANLREMPSVLSSIPIESIEYHADNNHFSNWLRARCEFELANRLRPIQVSEFRDSEDLRRYLITEFRAVLRDSRRGAIEDFARDRYDESTSCARIGGGSLGGKARGLAFMNTLLVGEDVAAGLDRVRVYVPRSLVLATHIFDEFIESNGLRTQTLYDASDEWIRRAFLKAQLPGHVVDDLRAFLTIERGPIAARSSSLLEDSQYHPFAGVYDTYMLPNNDPDDDVRLEQLCDVVRLVYASTFFVEARTYLEATAHRLEEESMAVILQPLVGSKHERYFYPSFAGVVRSYNFYPFGHVKPEDGVANVALGLGQLVVEGGESLRFCPTHPKVLPQLDSPKLFLRQSQRDFLALDLERPANRAIEKSPIVSLDLEAAERHGTLQPVGSVWSADNNSFYDGIYRAGARVVTFAHVLKADVFPLAETLTRILELGRRGMSGPVEIEFAVNLDSHPREFAVLQIRPYGVGGGSDSVDLGEIERSKLLADSNMALGNGVVDGVRDIIYVRPETFDAARTVEIAGEIAELNQAVRIKSRSSLLIGPGRWGSSNPWLGIPVTWGQISSARVIIETSLDNFVVDPSQGSHFFHNLTSMGIAYLTVSPHNGAGRLDWSWLDCQPVERETELVRHVRLEAPVQVRIDGRSSRGVVLKRSLGVAADAADEEES